VRSVAIFIALTESDANSHDNAGGNKVAIISRMKKMVSDIELCHKLGNTEVKSRCHKLRISAAANRAASLLENQLYAVLYA
jgi:hypothetical protein